MGKSTISMAIFNSYFDITRGLWYPWFCGNQWWEQRARNHWTDGTIQKVTWVTTARLDMMTQVPVPSFLHFNDVISPFHLPRSFLQNLRFRMIVDFSKQFGVWQQLGNNQKLDSHACLLLAFVTGICNWHLLQSEVPSSTSGHASGCCPDCRGTWQIKWKHRRWVELYIQMWMHSLYVYTILYRFDMVWHNPPWW